MSKKNRQNKTNKTMQSRPMLDKKKRTAVAVAVGRSEKNFFSRAFKIGNDAKKLGQIGRPRRCGQKMS